jgi:hypothetical protein
MIQGQSITVTGTETGIEITWRESGKTWIARHLFKDQADKILGGALWNSQRDFRAKWELVEDTDGIQYPNHSDAAS